MPDSVLPEPALPILTSNDHPAYFGDAMLDRFAAALVETLGRVWVLQDRVRVLETVLIQEGAVTRAQLDHFEPAFEDVAAIRAERDRLIRGVLDRLARG